jgi:hypothetical protein
MDERLRGYTTPDLINALTTQAANDGQPSPGLFTSIKNKNILIFGIFQVLKYLTKYLLLMLIIIIVQFYHQQIHSILLQIDSYQILIIKNKKIFQLMILIEEILKHYHVIVRYHHQ